MIKSSANKELNKPSNKIIVTAALPYANGSLHIGHLLEYVQADVYSRFLKLIGKDVLYICASDMHGTPIEINAKKVGMKPEKFAEKYLKEHQKDFSNFLIDFDNFYKTHSSENEKLVNSFFEKLREKGLVYTKEIEQFYDEKAKQFLPDRFIKGKCPSCSSEDQYGDICESCGDTYSPTDLIDPFSTISGSKPVMRKSTHYFFKLSKFSGKLKKWFNSKSSGIQPEIRNWLLGWLEKGLVDWCISRDAPYFGFAIPGSKKECGSEKYFYVWLDAPIGYISSTQNYCQNVLKNEPKVNWENYWKDGEVYHIIGKDIVYFHYLFWPAMLMAMEIPLPKLNVHGFITVNGKKMSKSRGTFFTAADFNKLYGAESLRFYYASHLDSKVVDVDLNFKDFQAVVNNVMMGNLGNFCYRTLTFAQKNYGEIDNVAKEKVLEDQINKLLKQIKEDYHNLDFKNAVKKILKISDLGNAYFQKSEPWVNKEDDEVKGKVGFCVNLARNLAIVVCPILPEFSCKIAGSLDEKNFSFSDLSFSWTGKIKKCKMLVKKIEKLPEEEASNEMSKKVLVKKDKELNDDVFPLKMAVGKIVEVNDHSQADKLYLLKVNFGSKIGKRQVVAGLKEKFSIKELFGRKAIFCINLQPAKLRGELSEAMTLMAEDKKGNLAFLDPGGSKVGSLVEFKGLKSSEEEVTFKDFLKLKMVVKSGKIVYGNYELVIGEKLVTVKGVDEGARIC